MRKSCSCVISFSKQKTPPKNLFTYAYMQISFFFYAIFGPVDEEIKTNALLDHVYNHADCIISI